MLRAIVLAAGNSTRMGEPKALLRDGNQRMFVARVLHTFAAAGIDDIAIVTGDLHEKIVAAVALDPPPKTIVRFLRNPDPARGQLSSLLTGLDSADAPGVNAALVTLVDVPFVTAGTVRAVVDTWTRTGALIVRPARRDRHGHPVLFSRALFGELRRADLATGAKSVLRAHADRIADVPVDDEGALTDLDTPEEYARALRS